MSFNLATVHFLQFLAYHLLIKKKGLFHLKGLFQAYLEIDLKVQLQLKHI